MADFLQEEICFLFGTQPRSDFSGQMELKMSSYCYGVKKGMHEVCSSQRQSIQPCTLKLDNKGRHLEFYRNVLIATDLEERLKK